MSRSEDQQAIYDAIDIIVQDSLALILGYLNDNGWLLVKSEHLHKLEREAAAWRELIENSRELIESKNG